MMRWLLLSLVMLGTSVNAVVQKETSVYGLKFESEAQQEQYDELIGELRCLVCQNQNLASSDAPLAKDLREEVHRLVTDGGEKKEVISFLVQRYGDFVLYRPPLNATTFLLWFGPVILLILAVFVALRAVNRRAVLVTDLSADDIARAEKLLGEDEEGKA